MPNKTTNTKPKFERHYICTVCSTSYIAKRHTTTPICGQACKDHIRAVKAATRISKMTSNRIAKIPYADNWLWIARECKRAKTVEILQDVDLVELFKVYNYKFKTYGYDSEARRNKFHICHISPVSGNGSVGLLNHLNLFVGGSLPNQKHGTKEYKGEGLSIRSVQLVPKWRVGKDDSEKDIFIKIQKYLGSKLHDYAKAHPIKKANRFVIAERISKLEGNTLELNVLQRMGTSELLKIEASLTDKEAYSMRLTAKRSLVVYLEELERFASYNTVKRDDYLFVSAAVRSVAQYLNQQHKEFGLDSISSASYRWYYEFNPLTLKPNKDISSLRDFIAFTAFETLQGATVNRQQITNTLHSYLQVNTLTLVENGVPAYDESYTDFSYLQDEVNEYLGNVPKVKDALSLVGLVDSAALARIEQHQQNVVTLQTYNTDLQCPEYTQYDYSDYNIQVEDGYMPLHTIANSTPSWLPF